MLFRREVGLRRNTSALRQRFFDAHLRQDTGHGTGEQGLTGAGGTNESTFWKVKALKRMMKSCIVSLTVSKYSLSDWEASYSNISKNTIINSNT
ncbi:MAG TPA: hypothetical protein VIQ51_18195 [Chryseosolibacter sp.]